MRARYVNPSELLTPVGQWIAARLPHVDRHSGIWGKADGRVFRVFIGPLYRNCVFDYTSTISDGARTRVISVFGVMVFHHEGAVSKRKRKDRAAQDRRLRQFNRQAYPEIFANVYDSEEWTGRE